MGEARSVMRTLKEERDEIRGQLDAMQVRARVPTIYNTTLLRPADDATCYYQGRDTLYPWTGLLIRPILVGTHVCCLLRDIRRASLFLSCTRRLRTNLVFHLRYASQVLQIRSQCLHPINYRAFSLIQSSTITTCATFHIYTSYVW